ncbi:TfuA-like protein [Umezawaea sp. NPDC059074]|uniref:TfuA-like protein n=1 Tax=Umezawaea sp. NPDC059074 TaxID=3346716 RepID=UPI00369252AA
MSERNTIMYVGPSAHGLDLASLTPPGIEIRPPVRRGDVDELLESGVEPGLLFIVDGTFHSFPSVGHAEIRTAMDRGWTVWGLCSMGAIRGAEMRSLGMRGFGDVYEMYAADPEFDDDEVALLHSTEAPFQAISEPMVHLRSFLAELLDRGVVTAEARDDAVGELKNRWYGERTKDRLKWTLVKVCGLDAESAATEVAGLHRHRLKTADLVRFLATRPWTDERP